MNKNAQAGYTLVELLVAVTLGLVLTAGVITVFVNSKQAFRAQESSGRLQENMRFSIEQLSRSIRQADFWSGVKTRAVTGTPAVTDYGTGSTCTASWITTINNSGVSQGLVGYAGGSASPIDCIAANDYVANSDVLALRYLDPNTYRTGGFTTSPASTQVWLRSSVGKTGWMFLGSDVASADARIANGDGVFNYQYRTSMIFLRPCSAKAGATCAATDDGGRPVPTLTSLELQGSSLAQVPLVEDVEMVRYLYGVDTNGDLIVDLYCTAAQITGSLGSCTSGWGSVISVRVGLIARGETAESLTDSTSYTLPGGFVYGPPSCTVGTNCNAQYSAASARFQRRLIVKDIQLRNRTRV